MNRKNNQLKHLKLLSAQTTSDMSLHAVNRPVGGWLYTVRQALGLSLKSVADHLQLSPQAIHQAEKSEASGTISLKQLETVAGAMDCRVVYILVPRHGSAAGQAVGQFAQAPRSEPTSRYIMEGPGAELPMVLR
jgi:predicted DNA-binding mobile mystery protein A